MCLRASPQRGLGLRSGWSKRAPRRSRHRAHIFLVAVGASEVEKESTTTEAEVVRAVAMQGAASVAAVTVDGMAVGSEVERVVVEGETGERRQICPCM